MARRKPIVRTAVYRTERAKRWKEPPVELPELALPGACEAGNEGDGKVQSDIKYGEANPEHSRASQVVRREAIRVADDKKQADHLYPNGAKKIRGRSVPQEPQGQHQGDTQGGCHDDVLEQPAFGLERED